MQQTSENTEFKTTRLEHPLHGWIQSSVTMTRRVWWQYYLNMQYFVLIMRWVPNKHSLAIATWWVTASNFTSPHQFHEQKEITWITV